MNNFLKVVLWAAASILIVGCAVVVYFVSSHPEIVKAAACLGFSVLIVGTVLISVRSVKWVEKLMELRLKYDEQEAEMLGKKFICHCNICGTKTIFSSYRIGMIMYWKCGYNHITGVDWKHIKKYGKEMKE